MGVAFGETLPSAVSSLFQSLGTDYYQRREASLNQWEEAARGTIPLGKASGDNGALFESSYNLILTDSDKPIREHSSHH